jgi:hypothetical protein
MDRFVLTDFSSQGLQVIFAEDKWTALVETFMVVTKANGALARIEREKLDRRFMIGRARAGFFRDPTAAPMQLKASLLKIVFFR